MKFIAARLHGYLDYLTVLIFLAAPTVLGFGGVPAKLSWLLAGVHLAMTLATQFPLGSFGGWLSRFMAGSKGSSARRLSPIAFLPDIFSVKTAFAFFAGMGLVIIAVGWLTDYADAG